MNLFQIRECLKTQTIYDLPLRVTFYARVSTDSDEQINSLGNQEQYYEELIKGKPAWTYVPGYIDEGKSGTSTRKRERFNDMVRDGKLGLFDLILTKEVSRFARNTVDSLLNARDLLRCGVGIFFTNDNINTLEPDSELRLTIMSGIAQDESRKISERVKFGDRQAIKNGRVFGSSRIYGYDYVHKKLVINPKEAAFVKEVFTLFATGEYSLNQLEKLFHERGLRSSNGNAINHATMAQMIRNPKYKGWFCGGKTTISDPFDGKQIRIPAEKWVMFKDESGDVPAIVSEEIWEQANAILEKRSRDVKQHRGQYNHGNLLSCKMYCTHCGVLYHRLSSVRHTQEKQLNSCWICSNKKKNGTDKCPSRHLYESEIKQAIFSMFQEFKEDAGASLESLVEQIEGLRQGSDLKKEVTRLEAQIDKEKQKRTKLLQFNLDGKISDEDFLTMSAEIKGDIAALTEQIEQLNQKIKDNSELKKRLDTMRKMMEAGANLLSPDDITPAMMDVLVDRIDATALDETHIQLDVFLNDGTEKTMELYQEKRGRGRPKKQVPLVAGG